MSWLGGKGDAAARRTGIVTVLDVGSSKVCCIVARLKPASKASCCAAAPTRRKSSASATRNRRA